MEIVEIFKSLQGEGPFTGEVAIFVRLWGCVSPFCSFCDTPYSWKKSFKPQDKSPFTVMSVDEIYKAVDELTDDVDPRIIITGGEPYAQDEIYDLIEKLNDNYRVDVETSGKVYIDSNKGSWYNIIMSPKSYDNETFLVNDQTDLSKIDYFKFVIGNENDVEMALNFIVEHELGKEDCYFMPLGAGREEQMANLPFVFNECVKHGIKLSARIHVLAFDTKRGV